MQDALQEGEESLQNKFLSQVTLILEGGWQYLELSACLLIWTVLANYDWLAKAPFTEPSSYLFDTLEFINARYFTIFTLPNVSMVL